MKVFIEEQRLKKWILLILIIPLLIGILPLLTNLKEIPDTSSDTFWGFIVTLISVSFVFMLLFSIQLNTKINEQGIYYKFFPVQFNEKFISWMEIESCTVTKQKYLKRFNYGYKICILGKNKGITMNLGGKTGLQLKLKNGKNIFIGTQKQRDAENILKTYSSKFSNK